MKTATRRIYLAIMIIGVFAASYGYSEPFGSLAPDIEAGRQKAAMCSACHSADGFSTLPSVPHLAGQQRAYLERALHAYGEGQNRHDLAMTTVAKRLSDSDIANIAAYFSSLPRMNSAVTAAKSRQGESFSVEAGKKRAAVCFACHSPDGISKMPGIPYLAGQHRTYLSNA